MMIPNARTRPGVVMSLEFDEQRAIYYEIRDCVVFMSFFVSSRRRHTRCGRDWSSDVCSSDLDIEAHQRGKQTPIGFRDCPAEQVALARQSRSEERRVGKECRSRWSPYH